MGNSLSQMEWIHMEGAMPVEERLTHKNLGLWMQDRAKSSGVKPEKEEEEEDYDDDPELMKMISGEGGADATEASGGPAEDSDQEEEKGKKEEAEDEQQGIIDKGKNWSAVNVACKESKLEFRGVLSEVSFTNWLWYRCVRPKLEETKSKLPEIDVGNCPYGIEDVDEIFNEYMPAGKLSKKDEKDDKKDKKDKK